MKSFNFILLFIHVCNEWYEKACTIPPKGRVRVFQFDNDLTSRGYSRVFTNLVSKHKIVKVVLGIKSLKKPRLVESF